LNTTVAVISVGEDISSDWHPGMHFFKASGSFSAAQTFSLEAGIRWLSFICMLEFSFTDSWLGWSSAARGGAPR
jgi:hypothetical protein